MSVAGGDILLGVLFCFVFSSQFTVNWTLTFTTPGVMCKADITFLLNPSTTEDCADCDVKVICPASTPSMALFRSLSPIIQSPNTTSYHHNLINSYIAPRDKRFNNIRSTCKVNIPMLSLAALYMSSEIFNLTTETAATSPTMPHTRKTHTPPCQIDGCKNLSVSRGCCVRHGGGSKCTVSGCNKRAKLYQRCFQHGGYKMCTKPGCTKKAKRYGHCWSHGGDHICEVPECTKVSTQGGFCWAHGGGNRCKHESCNRRSYQKLNYYCKCVMHLAT